VPPMETVGAIRARRVRAALRSTRWQVAFGIAAVVGAVLGAAIGQHAGSRVALAVGFIAVLVLAVLIVLWIRASGSAEDDFLTAWGRAHELTFIESPDLGEGTPLLRQGDKRKAENGLVGRFQGHPLTLCHYTYTVVTHSTDSNGVRTRQETDHPFTVARIDGVAGSISRMTFHPRSVLDRGWFDRADSALTSDRVVELESMELDRKYKLEVRDEVTDVSVRQIFEPSFIVWCTDQKDVFFELEDGELLVAVKHHLDEQAPLDALLDQSRVVLARLAAASASADRSPS
jgi:hypothetical protein